MTCLDGTVQTGPVSVHAGASLQVDGAVITGPLHADGAAAVVFCDSRISGPLSCSSNAVPPVDNGFTNATTGPKSGQCSTL